MPDEKMSHGTLVQRGAGGRYLPGSSGNAGGGGGRRPGNRVARFRQMVAEATDDGLEILSNLREIVANPMASNRDRIAACELLLAYFLGKPESHVSMDVETGPRRQAYDLGRLSPEERDRLGDLVGRALLSPGEEL